MCRGNILEDIYKESTATIKLHKVSNKISIQIGVRQGNTISPKLFAAILEEVFKNLDKEKSGIKINGEYFDLSFANDIVLMSQSTDELQQMNLQFCRESQKMVLKMNIMKTKMMFNNYILDDIKIR